MTSTAGRFILKQVNVHDFSLIYFFMRYFVFLVLDTAAEGDSCDQSNDAICRAFCVQHGSDEYNDLIADFEFDQLTDEEIESSLLIQNKVTLMRFFFVNYSEVSTSQSASGTSAVVTDPLEFTPATTNHPHRPHHASPASTAAPIFQPNSNNNTFQS